MTTPGSSQCLFRLPDRNTAGHNIRQAQCPLWLVSFSDELRPAQQSRVSPNNTIVWQPPPQVLQQQQPPLVYQSAAADSNSDVFQNILPPISLPTMSEDNKETFSRSSFGSKLQLFASTQPPAKLIETRTIIKSTPATDNAFAVKSLQISRRVNDFAFNVC